MELEVAEIISRVADIQLKAIDRLSDDFTNNGRFDLLIKYFQIKSDELVETKDKIREFYLRLREYPEFIGLIDEYQLGICSHILFQMESEWIVNNPDGVRGAWTTIHKIYQKFHPEYLLIWK